MSFPVQRYVSVLLGRVAVALVRQHRQRAAELGAGFAGADHLVDVAQRRRRVRIGQLLAIFGDVARPGGLRIGGLRQLLAKHDVDGALGSHHRDLGGREREREIAADVLGRHDVVGAAVGLAGDDGQLGDRRLGEGVEQLGAVTDDAAPLLRGAGEKSRDVDEGDERNVEAVAEAHEARGLHRGVDVEAPGQVRRLIGDDSDRPAVEPGEGDDDVAGVIGLDLEQVAVVDHPPDQRAHVVGPRGLVGDHLVERRVGAVGAVLGGQARRILAVVLG